MITHGSLFTGIGVFDLACKNEGIENLFGCDNDPFAKAHYQTHYPDGIFYDDVTSIVETLKVDILTFGFPCQDASLARPNKNNNPLQSSRTGLFYEAIRIIQHNQPRVVIAENVAAIRHQANDIGRAFDESGYFSGYAVLPACTFGALHRRERIFFIANHHSIGRHKIIEFLKSTLIEIQRKKDIWRKFHNTICENAQSETDRINIGTDYGTTEWLHQGLRAKAIGNSIYYPVAEHLIQQVKKIYFNK